MSRHLRANLDTDPVDTDPVDFEQWTRAIIDSIGDGIIVADTEGNLLLFNPAAERILGVGITDAKPDQWSETYGVYRPDGTPCPTDELPLACAISGKVAQEKELLIRRAADSDDVWVRARATPIFDAQGIRMGGVVIFHDITEQKRSAEAIKRAERLISIGTLAAGVAHELNNPVGAILLTAEEALASLASADAAEAPDESFERIRGQAHRCSEIVRRVLEFASQQVAPKSRQDVRTIIQNAVDLVRHKAAQASVTCRVREEDSRHEVLGNPTELAQVFVNLLSNAIEASQPGAQVAVSLRSSDDQLYVSVEDQGCGIAPTCHERVFDAFFTTQTHPQASGLGLSIAHGIVTDHGGSVSLNSQPGKGSRFTVTLPRCKASLAADGA